VELGARYLAADIPVVDVGEMSETCARSDAKRPSAFGQLSMEVHMAVEWVYFKAKAKNVFFNQGSQRDRRPTRKAPNGSKASSGAPAVTSALRWVKRV
jgi:hypothetical protein